MGHHYKKISLSLLISIAACTTFIACSNNESETVTDGPSVGQPKPPKSPPSPPGTPSEVVDNNAMYINFSQKTKDTYDFYTSRNGIFGSDCNIQPSAKGTHIECLIDVLELDLNFHGFELEVNVPKNMCDYASFDPYWYYTREIGVGPESITLNITEKTSGETSSRNYTSCVVDGVTKDSCTNFKEVTINVEDDSVSCIYDTSKEDNGANCCVGNYTVIKNITRITTTKNDDGTASTETETLPPIKDKGSWGVSLGECVGGATRGDWSRTANKIDTSVGVFYSVNDEGLRKTYNMPRNPYANSFQLANFYERGSTPSDSPHYHTGVVNTVLKSSRPYAMDALEDRSGTNLRSRYSPIPRPQDAYELTCYDRGKEAINSIRIFVRDWNTIKEFELYGSTLGDQGDPDLIGLEGVNCDYTTGLGICNDDWDWEDLLTRVLNIPGINQNQAYDFTTPSNRKYFFPKDIVKVRDE